MIPSSELLLEIANKVFEERLLYGKWRRSGCLSRKSKANKSHMCRLNNARRIKREKESKKMNREKKLAEMM